jgi:hypothetical protein
LQLFEHSGEKVCVALIIDLSERRLMEEELWADVRGQNCRQELCAVYE